MSTLQKKCVYNYITINYGYASYSLESREMQSIEKQPSADQSQLAAYVEDMANQLSELAQAGGLAELAAMLSLAALEASRSRSASTPAHQAPGHEFRAAG